MKTHFWIIALGVFMLAMGLVGYLRTGSPTALFINGGIAVATIVIGYFAGRTGAMLKVAAGWVGLNVLLLGFMTFRRIAAHSQTRAGSELIFGSMALFALVVLVILILRLRKSRVA